MYTLVDAFNQLACMGQETVSVCTKDEAHDLVTDMDKGLELLFRFWLNRYYPSHYIIGEEGEKPHLNPSGYYWYIDPIDGTTNYSQQRAEFCINIGCIHKNEPFLGLVGLPKKNQILTSFEDLNGHNQEYKQQICSEFYPHKTAEQHYFDKIQAFVDRPRFKTMALGYALSQMQGGHCDVFYKFDVKFWDIIAPLCILAKQSNIWDIELVTYDKNVASPFCTDPWFIDYLNARHSGDCRIGLITVTKKEDHHIKTFIQDQFYEYIA